MNNFIPVETNAEIRRLQRGRPVEVEVHNVIEWACKLEERLSKTRAKHRNGELLMITLGDSTFQQVTFLGVDSRGIASVKTKGGRYKTIDYELLH